MITSTRMAAVDRNAEALGVPRRQLMESSGHAIARTVRELADPGDHIQLVCGRGNNGGDAFVAARFLDEMVITISLLGQPELIRTDIAKANWDALIAAEYDCESWTDSSAIDLAEADLLVDAMIGTGVSGPLREPIASAAEQMNHIDTHILSVDVPSGVDPDGNKSAENAVIADHVVTFHDLKPGLVDYPAQVTIADIGIPPAAELFVNVGDVAGLDRDPDSHKGDAGRIVIIGGGPYTGAPALCGLAALRAGADLAIIACPEQVAETVQGFSPDLIVKDLPGDRFVPSHLTELEEIIDAADVLVIGPGLGDDETTVSAVETLLNGYAGRAVIDADALQAVPSCETEASLLCTPHQGELADMGGPTATDWEARATAVSEYATELQHTLLVKGEYDMIADSETLRVNRTGNPGMTVGGTGDVLAGVCGALFAAKDRSAVEAGAMGAFITGTAGDYAADHRGDGLIASDVLAAVPTILWGDHDA